MIKPFIYISLGMMSFTHTVSAELISQAELDAVVKEDIASAQMLKEICPNLIGDQPKLMQNIETFTQVNLKRLSQTTPFAQLQNDTEYQSAYNDAKQSLLREPKANQKTECENVLNFGHEIELD